MQCLLFSLVVSFPEFFLVSGGSSDIGLACINKIKDLGHDCISLFNSHSITPDFLPKSSYRLVDLADPNSTSDVISELLKLYPITNFISLASINCPSSFMDFSDDDVLNHIIINSIAPLRIARQLIPHMQSVNYGRITLTSSIGVKFGGSRNHFPYSFSKHSSEFIPSELLDLAANNIFTNVVRIGVTDTRRFRSLGKDINDRISLIPARRMAHPHEIADFLVWITCKENSFMTGELVNYAGGE